MGSRSTLAGMEVPVIGSDSVKWVEVSVPSSSASTAASLPFAPLTGDYASSTVIEDPLTYHIWYSFILCVCVFEKFPQLHLLCSRHSLYKLSLQNATGEFTGPFLVPSNYWRSPLKKSFPPLDSESLSQMRFLPLLLSARIRLICPLKYTS